MSSNQQQWNSRFGLLMSTIGAAIGLGNLWRFPYMAFKSGGGAFFVPYIIAVLITGIPLLIMEFAFGFSIGSSAVRAFEKISPKFAFIGHWSTSICAIVFTFYTVIISWSLCYIFFSLNLMWGSDTNEFFFQKFLNISNGPMQFGRPNLMLVGATFVTIALNYFFARNSIQKGLEKFCKITTPLLAILVIIIATKGVLSEGSDIGLRFLFKSDFSKIKDYKVWFSAFSQVFFSTTLGVGVMISYASYLKNNKKLVENALITAFSNCAFDILAGVAVFSILGNASFHLGKTIPELVTSGPGIAFVAFPLAINSMPIAPFFQALFGFLFFSSLFIAGISSSLSMMEVYLLTTQEHKKYKTSRSSEALKFCLISFAVSLLFTTPAGLFLIDIVDHYINNFGIILIGLTETIVIGYFHGSQKIINVANKGNRLKIGLTWKIFTFYLTPLILTILILENIYSEITESYSGYPLVSLLIFGLPVALFNFLYALYLGRRRGDESR